MPYPTIGEGALCNSEQLYEREGMFYLLFPTFFFHFFGGYSTFYHYRMTTDVTTGGLVTDLAALESGRSTCTLPVNRTTRTELVCYLGRLQAFAVTGGLGGTVLL